MAGWMRYFKFRRRRDPRQSARKAIVKLRQQIQMIEKVEKVLQMKIDDERKKAKANAITNERMAIAAIRRKRAHEVEMERLVSAHLQLEMQVNTLNTALCTLCGDDTQK